MALFSSPFSVAELCNLMMNHRTGITVRHVAIEEIPGVTYYDFVTSDDRPVSIVMEHMRDGWMRYAMRVNGYGWTGIGPVIGA